MQPLLYWLVGGMSGLMLVNSSICQYAASHVLAGRWHASSDVSKQLYKPACHHSYMLPGARRLLTSHSNASSIVLLQTEFILS